MYSTGTAPILEGGKFCVTRLAAASIITVSYCGERATGPWMIDVKRRTISLAGVPRRSIDINKQRRHVHRWEVFKLSVTNQPRPLPPRLSMRHRGYCPPPPPRLMADRSPIHRPIRRAKALDSQPPRETNQNHGRAGARVLARRKVHGCFIRHKYSPRTRGLASRCREPAIGGPAGRLTAFNKPNFTSETRPGLVSANRRST